MTSSHAFFREDSATGKDFSRRKISQLFQDSPEISGKNLPYQHEVKDFFVVKQIGKAKPLSFSQKVSSGYELAKSKYTEMSKRSPVTSYLAMTALMIAGVALFDASGTMFKASLTDNVPSFNGTVYPFPKAPDWFSVGGANKRLYSSYSASELVPAPRYNISVLGSKDEWKRSKVNPKITYPIVYMGQYKFNHIENKGSHPAVDIKLATGTPVIAISNGIVVKALEKTTGYGKHVVIKHVGVPEYGTLYSSYSHMSKLGVKVGQIVKKGEEIGKVGSTGTSTTPHIHFQIDRANAPFHPYWPFTWKDTKAAGVSYTEAVNRGIGQKNGFRYTLNPFNFIHQYEKYSGGKTPTKTATPEKMHAAPSKAPAKTSAPKASKKPAIPGGADVIKAFEITASPQKILEGDSVVIKIIAINSKNARIRDFNESVEFSYPDGKTVKKMQVAVRKGIAEKKLILNDAGRKNIRVKFRNTFKTVSVLVKKRPKVSADSRSLNTFKSDDSGNKISGKTTSGKAENFDHFQISGEKAVREGESIALTIRPLDKSGNAIASENFPAKGAYAISVANGIVSPNKIVKGDFSSGKFTFRVKGKKRGNAWVKVGKTKFEFTVLQKIASQEMVDDQSTKISASEKTPVVAHSGTKIFSDLYSNDPHAKAITYLKAHDIISGYKDGSFKPGKTVSRAEAIKMIFAAFEIKGENDIDNPFSDVANGAWFSPYILAAYDLDIVNGYKDGTFKPAKKVNRSEYFKIFLTAGDVVPNAVTSNPFADTPKGAWFAPYAKYAKEENLLDFGNKYDPTRPITRAEVAETIYRFLK